MLSVVWRTSDQGLLLIPDCLLKSKQSSCWREKIWIYMQESPKHWPWQRVNWWTFYTDFLVLTSLLFSPSLSPPLNIFIPASFPVQHHLVSRATPHISPPRDRDPPLHFRPFLTDTCLSTLLSLLHMTHYSSYKRLAGKMLGTNRWLSSNFLSLSKLPLNTITLANHKLEPHESRGWFYLYPEKNSLHIFPLFHIYESNYGDGCSYGSRTFLSQLHLIKSALLMLFRQWSVSAYPHTSTVESWSCIGLRCEIQIVNNSCFPKIVLIMKFCPTRGQKMSIHKCYLAGFNETSTVRHAQTLRLQRRLRFLAKIQKKKKPPAVAARVVFCSCGLLDCISCLWVELSHCSSQDGQLSSISRVLRFIVAVIILLRRIFFCWLIMVRFIKLSPETFCMPPEGMMNQKARPADMCLLACLHFCRCDSAGYSADLLC